MLQFIHGSQSYDGAFGMAPSTESHGGCSYCAVAALAMMGRLDQCPRTARFAVCWEHDWINMYKLNKKIDSGKLEDCFSFDFFGVAVNSSVNNSMYWKVFF